MNIRQTPCKQGSSRRVRGRCASPPLSHAREAGQAMVEYMVGTLFVAVAVAALADPSLFGINADILQAIKDFFNAFAYAISVAAT